MVGIIETRSGRALAGEFSGAITEDFQTALYEHRLDGPSRDYIPVHFADK